MGNCDLCGEPFAQHQMVYSQIGLTTEGEDIPIKRFCSRQCLDAFNNALEAVT